MSSDAASVASAASNQESTSSNDVVVADMDNMFTNKSASDAKDSECDEIEADDDEKSYSEEADADTNANTKACGKPEAKPKAETKKEGKVARPRIKWKKISVTILDQDGNEMVSHPFLEDEGTNHLDEAAARHMYTEKPYLAKYGTTTDEWEKCAKKVSMEKHPETGELLFKSLKGDRLKSRFVDLMKFVGQHQATAKKQSGTNDEEPSNHLLDLLESKLHPLVSNNQSILLSCHHTNSCASSSRTQQQCSTVPLET